MNIAIRCGSCQATLKAPDKLAGKKVKCPKCGQAIAVPAGAVPAGAEAIVAASPRSPKPQPAPARPAAADKSAPSVRLPLLSFDELKVPSRLRRSIEKEVGSEKLIWLGRPSPESLLRKAKIGAVFGLVITILVAVAVVVLMNAIEGEMAPLILWGSAGLVMLTLALPMLTMPIWVRWLVNYRDCYVLTPTRAIVFDNEKILRAKAKPYTADRLGQRSLRINDDGSGSIIFGTEVVDFGTRQKRRKKDREGPRGEKITEITTTTWREKANKPVGFIDIHDVEKVEAMLRQVLNLGPPAAKDVD